jgi:hypothetical protein
MLHHSLPRRARINGKTLQGFDVPSACELVLAGRFAVLNIDWGSVNT